MATDLDDFSDVPKNVLHEMRFHDPVNFLKKISCSLPSIFIPYLRLVYKQKSARMLKLIFRLVLATIFKAIFRNIHRRWSLKKALLKILQNSLENTCVRVSFLTKCNSEACNFIKNEALAQVFYWEFCETPFSQNTSGRLLLALEELTFTLIFKQ